MREKLTGQDISFIGLQTAVFCVECEVISKNNTPHCLACGSKAVISLARVLGGSLRGQQTAHLIADAELDRLVRELLRTVPTGISPDRVPASFAMLAPSRHHARAVSANLPTPRYGRAFEPEIRPETIDLEPAISVIAERAQTLTGASGAAIALRHGSEIGAGRAPAAPRLTWACACKPTPAFPPIAFAPGKLSSAMTPTAIRGLIWPPAAAWARVPSWLPRCATSAEPSVSLKSFPAHRMLLMRKTLRLCSFSPA